MIVFEQTGNFNNLTSFLTRAKNGVPINVLEKYGRLGVSALSSATPKDSGLTAQSWSYSITRNSKGAAKLSFTNSNIQNGCPIAIILQYGHGTQNGGWVEGRDYINPALKPIFDNLANEAWKEVVTK